ncbi:TPA: hypothetical protein N0F65_007562 [Lagenidium giganteum]|uniref:non-specific serine/threonine protein kinase n=1 Tax=Lagenidium giganteum TaxID=4803 RepID=A0AAV2ZIY0_9STRA|nr:TPA: hypothetical protein N0F65_007562 [Lagenidium giganteum]
MQGSTASATTAVLPSRTTADDYRVLARVGKGAYGDVYLGQVVATGEQVCMKEVDLEFLTPAERTNCLSEVEFLRSLPAHRNILAFHDAFWASPDKSLMLVTEYADDGDLDRYLHKRHSHGLPVPEALKIFHQIALGVEFLHRQHILHRDLKTKNVFLFADGRVVVGDFGTCKVLSSTRGDPASTLIGSPLYMSPETLEGVNYGFEADIWALGCVLYELLTGKAAFAAASYPAVVYKITQGSPEPLQSTIEAPLRALIDQMLDKDRKKRPSMAQIVQSTAPSDAEATSPAPASVVEETTTVDRSPPSPQSQSVATNQNEPEETTPLEDNTAVELPIAPTQPPLLPPPPPTAPAASIMPSTRHRTKSSASERNSLHASAVFPTSRAHIAQV